MINNDNDNDNDNNNGNDKSFSQRVPMRLFSYLFLPSKEI